LVKSPCSSRRWQHGVHMPDPLTSAIRYLERVAEYLQLADLAETKEKGELYRQLATHYITLAESDVKLERQIEQARARSSKKDRRAQ
jgi:hypothetical protein